MAEATDDSTEEAAQPAQAKPLLVIQPGRTPLRQYVREIGPHRDLVWVLATRDLKLRYRQTVLGAVWVVLQPLIAAAILGFVFSRVARLPTDGVPAFVFTYTGMLAWNAFSQSMTRASTSLVGNAHLISKIFFPRILLPLSTMVAVLVDFLVGGVVLVVLVATSGVGFGARILLAPAVLLLILLISQGVGTWLAALAVKYRDVAQVMPVLLQLLLYASPVAYAVSAIPDRYVTFYRLNPLTPLLEAFRWTVLGTARPPAGSLLYAAAVAVVVSIAGVAALKRMEGAFADVI